MRARSESPMHQVGEHVNSIVSSAAELSPKSSFTQTLYGAEASRKQAEQAAALLANRIRLLRAEEEKAQKKLQETELKTKEIVHLQQHNDIKREEKKADALRREAAEQALREQTLKQRQARQEKLIGLQDDILHQNRQTRDHIVNERDVLRKLIAHQNEEALAKAWAKRARGQARELSSARIRAKSEGRNQLNVRRQMDEKISNEQLAQQQQERAIEKMEREEADLLARLQRTQSRQKNAVARLENVMNRDPLLRSFPSSICTGVPLDSVAESTRSLALPNNDARLQSTEFDKDKNQGCWGNNMSLQNPYSTEDVRKEVVSSKPPRQPRSSMPNHGGPGALCRDFSTSSSASTTASVSSRSGSNTPVSFTGGTSLSPPLALSVHAGTVAATCESSTHGSTCGIKTLPERGCMRPASRPSAELSQRRPVSARSRSASSADRRQRIASLTPRSTGPIPIALAYITADGHRLEIPAEEELDLNSLLND